MRQRGILRGLTPGHLLAFTVLVGIFVFLNTHPIRPHDFWWHLAVGREIVRTGRIPLVDTFSYTRAGTPYPSYAMFWLAEVLYYGLYAAGGPALIVFFHSLLITTAYGLILWAAWEAGGPRAAAAGTLLAAALGIDDWNVRPQAFGFLAGAMFLRALSGLERSPRWRWAFPLGMLLWVNTHGSFPIGLLMAGLAVAEAAWRVFRKEAGKEALGLRAQAFALALLSTGLNPRGFGVYEYLAMMARNPMLRSLVPEWAPPGLDRHGLLFYIGLAGVGALLLLPPRRTDPGLLLRLGPFAALGLWTSQGGADLRRDAGGGDGVPVAGAAAGSALPRPFLRELSDLGGPAGLSGVRGPAAGAVSDGDLGGLPGHQWGGAGLGGAPGALRRPAADAQPGGTAGPDGRRGRLPPLGADLPGRRRRDLAEAVRSSIRRPPADMRAWGRRSSPADGK
jgi:hypothetical protein